MSIAAHPGVQGETISLGHPFQSGVRPIHWTEGADHEGLAPLLWAERYTVGDGAAQNLWHSIGILGGLEVQPGALGILFQQSLALEAATNTLTDQMSQFLEFSFSP